MSINWSLCASGRYLPLILTALVLAVLAFAGLPAAAQADPAAGQFSEANGVTLAYEEAGPADGEVILLLAGVGMQLTDWPDALIDGLAGAGYRVIRFDNRDTGLSTSFAGAELPDEETIGAALQAGEAVPLPYSVRDLADDATALLDDLGIAAAHVVGASLGGSIAQLLALDSPERVLSLTLIFSDSGDTSQPLVADPEAFSEVPPLPVDGSVEELIEYQVRTGLALQGSEYRTDEEQLRDWARQHVARAFDPEALQRQQLITLVGFYELGPERFGRLQEISVPTVVIHGDDDPLVPVAEARQIAARIPDAELLIIPGLGHDLPGELVPEIVNAITGVAARAQQHVP